MKKKLKIMVSLIGVLAMISANVVFAAESQKVPQKIQEIANGSDDIYGDGAPLEHVENGDERFQSGGIDHTHQYIVANALTILNNDKGGSLFNDELNARILMEATDWPDKVGNETDFGKTGWDRHHQLPGQEQRHIMRMQLSCIRLEI